MFVYLGWLVAKNAYILVEEANLLWTSRTIASWWTELRSSASSLKRWWLFLCLWCLSCLLGVCNKVVVQIIFTFLVVPQFTSLWASSIRSTTVAFSTVSVCFNKVKYPFGVTCMSLSDGVSEPAHMMQLSTGGVTSSSILLGSMSCKVENEIYLEMYFPQTTECMWWNINANN